MFRYLTNNTRAAAVLSLLVVGAMTLEIMMPTLAFGMMDPAENNPEQSLNEAVTDTVEEPSPTETTIETGEAVTGLEASTEVNTTEVTTDDDTAPVIETEQGDSDASDPPSLDTEEDPSLLEIKTDNNAALENNATSSAVTGENSAGGETVTINTGDAIAYADIINVVNTNIVNSTGLISFINDTLGYENFDLRSDFEIAYGEFNTAQSTTACGSVCDDQQTNLDLQNDATVNNNVTVLADTGQNTASGDTTTINTGNAYASANIINLANTNIVDSQYLLLIFNNFSSYAGNIVLPNSSFFDRFLSAGGGISDSDVSLHNEATVNNNSATIANTGNNSASGADTTINTGNAYASSDTTNLVNQNLIGATSFSMLIRVHGDWSGSIQGLPEGLTWSETSEGIRITSIYDSRGIPISTGSISGYNQATVNNNVQVFALTGDNKAAGEEVNINTGSAYANSSIMNIVNTNVIGSNWSNLIFNIYGNWSGNLTFGQPDLWLAISAVSEDQPIMPGSKVSYTFTVFNRGDTTAREVSLESLFETGALQFTSGQESASNARWQLGDIKAGDTREITYNATVSSLLGADSISALPLTARVDSINEDSNPDDNEDTVVINIGRLRSEGGSATSFPAHFDITKSADKSSTKSGDVVTYTVEFFNRGGQLYDAMLVDSLVDEDYNVVLTQSWPLGEIKNWETVTIEYDVKFDDSLAPGKYTNYAQLIGFHGSRKPIYQTPYESRVASHVVSHNLKPAGEVLGISTSSCEPYLTQYLRIGRQNSASEVRKLQIFLNEHISSKLPVTGFFGPLTDAAVRTFQRQYSAEVLGPWGIMSDTGYVYYTTQKTINELVCEGARSFPLHPEQEAEIKRFQFLRY